VSNALRTFGSPEAEETAEFAKMFDRWFDVMNVCNFNDGRTEKKNILNIHTDLQRISSLK